MYVTKLFKRRGIWYARIIDGKRYRTRSTKQKSREMAREVASSWSFPARQRTAALDTALVSWVAANEIKFNEGSGRNIKVYIKHWLRFFKGRTLVDDIGDTMVAAYSTMRLKSVKPSTLKKDLQYLQKFFAWCKKRYGCQEPEIQKPRVPTYRKVREYCETELDALERAASENAGIYACLVLQFFRWSGLRVGMVERLKWEHIDTRIQRFRIPGNLMKSGAFFEAPILPQLKVVLGHISRFVAEKEGFEYVTSSESMLFPGFTYGKLYRIIKDSALEAGLLHFEPRDYRRNFHNWLRRQGFTLEENSVMLGHDKRVALEHYSNCSLHDVERRITKLDLDPKHLPSRAVSDAQ